MAKNKPVETLPLETDAASTLLLTVDLFRNRMIDKKMITADDIEFLERTMRLYGDLRIKENETRPRHAAGEA